MSTVVVVGVGDVGSAVAALWVGAGHDVRLVSRRGPQQLAAVGLDTLIAHPNLAVVPAAGAALGADAVLLAVPYHAAVETLDGLGDLANSVIVDATNYNRERDGDAVDPGPGGSTKVLATLHPHVRWVKAFNMLWAGWLRSDARPDSVRERVVFLAGDDLPAIGMVAQLIDDAGFVPFLTGGLAQARSRQVEGTPAWNRRLTAGEAGALLPEAPGLVDTV